MHPLENFGNWRFIIPFDVSGSAVSTRYWQLHHHALVHVPTHLLQLMGNEAGIHIISDDSPAVLARASRI